MIVTVHGKSLELVQGDITQQQVDAVVNAANSRLAGGGGADGAIHRRGGPSIMEETDRRYPTGCATGWAEISGAGELPARYVIHAVGPLWRGGNSGEELLLAGAHRRALELAVEYGCDSVAFPAISTGAYGFPLDEAGRVALTTVVDFLAQHDRPKVVRFVLFDKQAYETFATVLREVANSGDA